MMSRFYLLWLGILVACGPAADTSHERLRDATQAWATMPSRMDLALTNTWPAEVRALTPIQVYEHRNNVVIATRWEGGIESGFYIGISISSYHPTNIEGWTFELLADQVWHYERKLGVPNLGTVDDDTVR